MWNDRWAVVAAAALVLGGCSYPERNAGPDGGTGTDDAVVSVEYLKSYYKGYPYTFTENYRIRGCVVSTDRSGNYYRTLAVLDDTGAIEVKLDGERLFETYFMGCTVEIYCNGLTLGDYGGTLQLGAAPGAGYETGYIDREDIPVVVRIVGASDTAVVPEAKEIAALGPDDVGRFVAFDGVQFVAGGRAAWCEPAPDDATGFADTDRYLIDREGNMLVVRTSRYADFASWTLPEGSGKAEGILSLFGGKYQLRVIRPAMLYTDMVGERFETAGGVTAGGRFPVGGHSTERLSAGECCSR